MSGLLESVKNRFRRRQVEKTEADVRNWASLVRALADASSAEAAGKPRSLKLSDEDVFTVLVELDRTPEQLESAVQLVLERRRLAAELADGPKRDAEITQLESERGRRVSEFAKLRDEHNLYLERVDAQIIELSRLSGQNEGRKLRLHATAPAALLAELRKWGLERIAMGRRLSVLETDMKPWTSEDGGDQQSLASIYAAQRQRFEALTEAEQEDENNPIAAQYAVLCNRVNRAGEEIDSLKGQIAQIEAKEREIIRRMENPDEIGDPQPAEKPESN